MVLGLYEQTVIGFLVGLCLMGFSILWVVLDIRKEARDVVSENQEGGSE